MKVLVLTPYFPRPDRPNRGMFVANQARALEELGLGLDIVEVEPAGKRHIARLIDGSIQGTLDCPANNSNDILAEKASYIELPRYLMWHWTGYSLFLNLLVKRGAELRRGEYTVIHAHEIFPCAQAARLLAKQFDIPYVVTIHGISTNARAHFAPSRAPVIQRVLTDASRVILVGEKLREPLAKLGAPAASTCVINNGIRLDRFSETPAHLDQEFADKKIVLSVSNLKAPKGVDINLRAVKQLVDEGMNDLHYVIIGDGPERRELESLVEQLQLAQHVSFLGQQSPNDVMKYMAACDVFCLPSWNEAFGMVYLEAMLQGKPVIGVRGEGPQDFIEEGVTGLLVEPKSAPAVSAALERLLGDDNFRREIGANAQREVHANWTWTHNAQRMSSVYSEVSPHSY